MARARLDRSRLRASAGRLDAGEPLEAIGGALAVVIKKAQEASDRAQKIAADQKALEATDLAQRIAAGLDPVTVLAPGGFLAARRSSLLRLELECAYRRRRRQTRSD